MLFGSRRLPELGHALGKGIGAFKRGLEGKDQDGKLAGFTNEPVNLDEYYRFYEGKKYLDPNKKEE